MSRQKHSDYGYLTILLIINTIHIIRSTYTTQNAQ